MSYKFSYLFRMYAGGVYVSGPIGLPRHVHFAGSSGAHVTSGKGGCSIFPMVEMWGEGVRAYTKVARLKRLRNTHTLCPMRIPPDVCFGGAVTMYDDIDVDDPSSIPSRHPPARGDT